jgi:peptidoglycan/xylan/chitin deacetylase (PgdA/CDA1 family)
MISAAFKKILHLTQVWRLARYMNRRRVAILMYHGITPDNASGDWVHVRQSSFAKQMAYLKGKNNPVSLQAMLEMLKRDEVAPNSVVVTFDDGYKSVADLAIPILREFEIPCSIFVTTDFIAEDTDNKKVMWFDRIQVLARSAGQGTLDLASFDLPALQLGDSGHAIASTAALVEQLKLRDDEQKVAVITYFEEQLSGAVDLDAYPQYLPMSWSTLERLANDPLVDIGGHTCNHPILSRLTPDRLSYEISECKRALESRLGIPIAHFAYPNGRLVDIGDEAKRLVQEHFKTALTTVHDLADTGSDRWLLPRIGIGRDMPMSTFQQVLAGLF